MKNLKEYWGKKGYTDKQVRNHYIVQRAKQKELRERRKKNNEKNKDLIAKIKKELINAKFLNRGIIYRITPTVDGEGFYARYRFGEKNLSYFCRFDCYDKKIITI